MMKFSVSAIVPAYNVEEFIKKCIKSILSQSYTVKEIFFINDGSTDNTLDIVKKISKKSKIPIRIINRKHSGMRGHMINSVLPKIKSDVIWSIDADSYYHKDYLKECIKHLSKEKVAGVIGRIHPIEIRTYLDRLRELELKAKYENYKPFTIWVIKKDIIDKIGGFDERVWLFDDKIFGRTVQRLGYKLVFEPKAKWYHNERTSFKGILKRRFKWGYAYFLTLKYYSWIPYYVPLWTILFIFSTMLIFYNLLPLLIYLASFFLLSLTIYLGKFLWKYSKNPIDWTILAIIKIYTQLVTTFFFWIGILIRIFKKKIL